MRVLSVVVCFPLIIGSRPADGFIVGRRVMDPSQSVSGERLRHAPNDPDGQHFLNVARAEIDLF
jgi:hypothetical protein